MRLINIPSFLHIISKTLLYKVLALLRNRHLLRRRLNREINLRSLQNNSLLQNLILTHPMSKRSLPIYHFKKYHSQTPHIHLSSNLNRLSILIILHRRRRPISIRTFKRFRRQIPISSNLKSINKILERLILNLFYLLLER